MTSRLDAAFTYTDFKGFASLKRAADKNTPQARRAAAQQFESLFVGMVLERMRSASTIKGGLFSSQQLSFYRDLHDRQLALTLSRGHGIGLADSILRQLGGGGPKVPASASARQTDRQPATGIARQSPVAPSPEAFVQGIWPDAKRAAAKLGVPPKALVAQAALETGWGQHALYSADGQPTYNVFAIKAGSSWTGPRVNVSTLEFVNGVPEKRTDAFRAYDSLEDAFNDYVSLVSGQPRYQDALNAKSGNAYAKALEAGGYSTDPRYAEKISAIMAGGLPGPDSSWPADGR